jgi:hypothetical protein
MENVSLIYGVEHISAGCVDSASTMTTYGHEFVYHDGTAYYDDVSATGATLIDLGLAVSTTVLHERLPDRVGTITVGGARYLPTTPTVSDDGGKGTNCGPFPFENRTGAHAAGSLAARDSIQLCPVSVLSRNTSDGGWDWDKGAAMIW